MKERARWHGRRLCLLAVAAIIASVMPSAALAAEGAGAACAITLTWSFSPPLTQTARSGVVTQQATGVCTTASATTSPAHLATESGEWSWPPDELAYTGNCHIALVTVNGVPFLLLGGSLVISAVANPPVNHWLAGAVLTPNEVCNESSASGAFVGAFTLTG